MPAQALLERGDEAYWLMVFLEEISERFGGKLLERTACLSPNGFNGLPSVVIELHALAGHALILEQMVGLAPAFFFVECGRKLDCDSVR